MVKPLVSYLVPNYNKGRWLCECLWSVFSQSYRPIEVIVCDNGSTDQSKSIIHLFEDISWFHSIYCSNPLGVAKAFNLALSQAKGEYIAMLGGDDVVEPDHLEKVMKVALSNPNIDIVFGSIKQIDALGKIVSETMVTEEALNFIHDRCSIGHSTGVTKKLVFDEIGGYDENLEMSADWEFLLRALKMDKKFISAGKVGYQWRRFSGSGQLTTVNQGKSKVRVESHTYIRQKYNLKGMCKCGCEAMGVGG